MTEPGIAVVVPVLNEAACLPRLLPKLDQLNPDELMLVDGGSTDGSEKILAASGLPWMRSKPGRALQMNAGAAHTSSEIILFLHVDTQIDSCHFEDVKRVMRDPGMVGGRFDVHLSGKHPAFRIIETFINLRSRWTRISTGDQAIFVRRDVFERLGGFPEQPLMEDVEFSRRLKREGKIACLKRCVVTSSRRWESHGIARTVLLMWKLRLLYWLGVPADRLAAMYREVR